MEKLVCILIISVVADYWLKRLIRIAYELYSEIKKREYYREKGIKYDLLGDPIDEPKKVVNYEFRNDFEQLVFKRMEK